jgi:hypothetical protein
MADLGQYRESSEFRKTEELARAALALQELRYLAWMALKAFDSHAALDSPMEAIRAALPTSQNQSRRDV